MTCPAGNTTTHTRPGRDHKGRTETVFVFPAAMCAACPLRNACTTSKTGRTVGVGVYHDRIETARRTNRRPETIDLLRRRSKVERKIDHLRDLGIRKARYRDRRKTRLQALLAATVANFKRLAVLDAFGNVATIAA